MPPLDREFVARIDETLIQRDVPLHARPLSATMAYFDANNIRADIFSDGIYDDVMAIYRELYPSDNFFMPPLLVGGVGFRDRFYLARVNIGYGRFAVNPLSQIEVPESLLAQVFRENPDQGWRAFYGVADLYDFGYGIEDLRGHSADAAALWHNARAAMETTARILSTGAAVDATVQTICLTAELAMKGMLAHIGWSEPQRRALHHRLGDIAAAVAREQPRATDTNLIATARTFPDYVQTRYTPHGLTRLTLIELAMKAQYIAADVLRRVSARDLANQLAQDPQVPARSFP